MWKVELILRDFPAMRAPTVALGLADYDSRVYSEDVIRDMGGLLFPGLPMSFSTRAEEGMFRGGTAHIEGNGPTYRPRVEFWGAGNTYTGGLWLHEFAHVCCGGARPRSYHASNAERMGIALLIHLGHPSPTPEQGAEVAAWCGALILGAMIGFAPGEILCDILAGTITPDREELELLYRCLADHADLATNPQALLDVVAEQLRLRFRDAGAHERYLLLDDAMCLFLNRLGAEEDDDWILQRGVGKLLRMLEEDADEEDRPGKGRGAAALQGNSARRRRR